MDDTNNKDITNKEAQKSYNVSDSKTISPFLYESSKEPIPRQQDQSKLLVEVINSTSSVSGKGYASDALTSDFFEDRPYQQELLYKEYAYAYVKSLPDPFCVVSVDNSIVYANEKFFNLVGATTALPCQLDTIFRYPLVISEEESDVSNELVSEEGKCMHVKVLTKKLGSDFYALRIAASLEQSHIAANFHAQRLETLGMFSSGIVHDFNNMLTGILGHVSYLKNILPKTGPHVESLNAIQQGAKKSSSLSQEILKYSKLDTSNHYVSNDICSIIRETVSLLKGSISPKYNLRATLPEQPLYVLSAEGKIAQLIVNLVINARDAIDQNGFIEVGVEIVDDIDRLCRALKVINVPERSYVRLYVLDDGKGIPKTIIDKIFDPFFTSKKEKGTGLGLATVRSIVNSLDGTLEVFSEEGVGTSISIFLPLLDESSSSFIRQDSESDLRLFNGQNEKILVIDDEKLVSSTIKLSLKYLNYDVCIASSGEEAISKVADKNEQFDLILLDMIMPNISGEEMFFKLKAINPDVRVLIISGYTNEEVVQKILDNGGKGYIQKPFSIYELSKKVKECLFI
jgi:signal transduction histidine kinase/CheY-like chemotaxis protein